VKEIREMVRTLSINQKTNLQTKHCMEGFRGWDIGFRAWDLGFSMYEIEIKSSSKSHGFFIKRAYSFLVEDKLFNQKIKFREDLLCLNI